MVELEAVANVTPWSRGLLTRCRRSHRRHRAADCLGPWPGVVMLHEGWGIDDVLRRHADRLASAGYLVYAPDLLGEGSWLRCIRIAFKAYQARAAGRLS